MVDHHFIFESLDGKAPNTARKVHIRRLYDIFQVCVQKRDYVRARRAWAVLARCKEFDWMSMWTTGLMLLRGSPGESVPQERLEFLRTVMLQNTGEKESILQELLFSLIIRGEHREALNELELYLPAFPYQDNPIMHTYAGLLSLYLAQPTRDSDNPSFNKIQLRDAQSHFEQAKRLDPENVMIQAFLERIPELHSQRQIQSSQHTALDSEDDMEDTDDTRSDAMDDDRDKGRSRSDEDNGLSTPRSKRTRIAV